VRVAGSRRLLEKRKGGDKVGKEPAARKRVLTASHPGFQEKIKKFQLQAVQRSRNFFTSPKPVVHLGNLVFYETNR